MQFVSVRSPRASKLGQPAPEPSRAVAFGLFAVVVAIFFFPHLSGSAFLWEDFTEQYLPFQRYAAAALMSGEFPFWNPYTFGGMPFFADLQNGVFYPGHVAVAFLTNGEPSVWWLQFHVILHYWIAMLGAWYLAGRLGVRGWGRLFAGIGYGLTGMLVVHMIHPNMVFHMAWFPGIVGFYWGGMRENRLTGIALSGLLTGLVLLSGHPQTALYILVFLVGVTIFEGIRKSRDSEEGGIAGFLPTAGVGLASMILALGLFAVQYLPSQELAENSRRAEMSYEASTDGSLEMRQILTLVAPDFFGVASGDPPADLPFWLRDGADQYYFWETTIYVGVVTLLLALLGIVGGGLGGAGWFLLGAGLFGIAFGLGDNFLLHPIVGKLPGISTFRIPARMGLYFALAMPILAGAGLSRLISGSADRSSLERPFAIGAGLLAFVAILLVTGALDSSLGVPPQIADSVHSTALAALLLTVVTAAIVIGALRGKVPALGAAVGLLLLGTIDLFIFGVGKNQASTDPELLYTANEANLAELVVDPPNDIFRTQMRGTGQYSGAMLMQRNQGPYSRIMLIEGYNPLLLERVYPQTSDFDEAMALMNTRYAIGVDSATGRPLGYRQRTKTYAHARLMFDARVVSPDAMEEAIGDRSVDFSRTVLLESDPGVTLDGSGAGSATITTYDASTIVVETESTEPSVLLLSEVYYPAWRAYVDGVDVDILRANWSLRAVPLPAGKQTVEFRYESSAFSTGRNISIASLILLVAGIVLLRRREVKSSVDDENVNASEPGE